MHPRNKALSLFETHLVLLCLLVTFNRPLYADSEPPHTQQVHRHTRGVEAKACVCVYLYEPMYIHHSTVCLFPESARAHLSISLVCCVGVSRNPLEAPAPL